MDVDVKPEFPQYKPRIEIDDPPCAEGRTQHCGEYYSGFNCFHCGKLRTSNVRTTRAFCPLCGAKLTVRTFVLLKPNPQERTDEEQADYEAMAHRDAERDSEEFMQHLASAHGVE